MSMQAGSTEQSPKEFLCVSCVCVCVGGGGGGGGEAPLAAPLDPPLRGVLEGGGGEQAC